MLAVILALVLSNGWLLADRAGAGMALPEEQWYVEAPLLGETGTVLEPGRIWRGDTLLLGGYVYSSRYSDDGEWGVVKLRILEPFYHPIPHGSR